MDQGENFCSFGEDQNLPVLTFCPPVPPRSIRRSIWLQIPLYAIFAANLLLEALTLSRELKVFGTFYGVSFQSVDVASNASHSFGRCSRRSIVLPTLQRTGFRLHGRFSQPSRRYLAGISVSKSSVTERRLDSVPSPLLTSTSLTPYLVSDHFAASSVTITASVQLFLVVRTFVFARALFGRVSKLSWVWTSAKMVFILTSFASGLAMQGYFIASLLSFLIRFDPKFEADDPSSALLRGSKITVRLSSRLSLDSELQLIDLLTFLSQTNTVKSIVSSISTPNRTLFFRFASCPVHTRFDG